MSPELLAHGDPWPGRTRSDPTQDTLNRVGGVKRAYLYCIRYDRTGAAYEHAGYGRMASEAKNTQLDFLKRRLLPDA